VVGLGLSFENSGLDPDRKVWQSAHICNRLILAGDLYCCLSHCRWRLRDFPTEARLLQFIYFFPRNVAADKCRLFSNQQEWD